MVAVRRLYHCAKLVHADLSEYNILVAPMSQVENALEKNEEMKDSLQIVLIDFGQAIEIQHPSAKDLLRRDLAMVKSFFDKQGITTLSEDDSVEFVLKEIDQAVEDSETELEEDVNHEDDTINDIEDEQWRHSIKGWDDLKDMEWIETKLTELSCKRKA